MYCSKFIFRKGVSETAIEMNQVISLVNQISSQPDLMYMSSFAGPSYLTIRSSVYIILI